MDDLQVLKKQLATLVVPSANEKKLKEQKVIIQELQQLEQELVDTTSYDWLEQSNKKLIHDKLRNLKEQCKKIIPSLWEWEYDFLIQQADRGRANENTLLESTVHQSIDYFHWIPGYQRLAKNALK